MTYRVTMPNGNSHSSFVLASIKWFEGKGVVCLDARGKPLEWIPVEDIEDGRRVRDMITRALNGERRYRSLDWSFLNHPHQQQPLDGQPKDIETGPVPPAPPRPQPKPTK